MVLVVRNSVKHARCPARWGRASALAFALLVSLLLGSRSTAAQPRVELVCGSQDDFFARLQREYGLLPNALALTAVRVWKRPQGDYALLVQGPGGARQLTHPRCETLQRAALVMAAASGEAPPDTGAPTASPALPTTKWSSAAESPEQARAQAVSRPIEDFNQHPAAHALGLGAAAGAEFGLAPSTTAVFEASASARWRRFGVRVVGRYFLPQTAEGLTPEGYGLRWRAWGTRLSGLYVPAPWINAEVGLRLDHVHGSGLRVPSPNSDRVWLLSPELELHWIPLRWQGFAFGLGVRARVGLRRPRFALEPDYTVIHQLPRWGAATLLRIGWEAQ